MKKVLQLGAILLFLLALTSNAWFSPGDIGVDLQKDNTQNIGLDRTIILTNNLPISLFGRIDNPTYGVAKYQLQIFLDSNGDGYPTVADGSSWKTIMTVNNWDVPTAGLLFMPNVLSTKNMIRNTNYIVRVWGENLLGQQSSNTNTMYWANVAAAQTALWRSNNWFSIYISTNAFKPN